MELPKYQDLPVIEQTGERHAWHAFGEGDQLGTVNLLDAAAVKAAAELVRTGRVVHLSLPLDFDVAMYGSRGVYTHNVTVNRGGRDDSLDGFMLQGSTQWDGLRHVRYREFGYYGGRQDEDLEGPEIGIEHWARHGIVGRGVLIDMDRYFASIGRPIDPTAKTPIGGPEFEAYFAWAGIETRPGDIYLLRTGWLTWFKSISVEERRALGARLHPGEGGLDTPGLNASQATAAWLWDHQVAALLVDNHAVEAIRITPEDGYQHRRLIALQGMAIGELWDLDELAEVCAAERRYEFMFVAAPLDVPNGVGSPGNGYAIL